MSDFVYSRDTWFAPLPIDSTNNVLVFSDNSVTNEVITLPLTLTGNPISYLNKNSFLTAVAGAYFGVQNEITSQINAASSNTYEFRAFKPQDYPAAMGLKLVQTSGSGTFTWNFTSGSWTFNARILGYGSETPSSDDTSKAGEIAAPYSTYGTWVSHTIQGGEATDKRRRPTKLIKMSGSDVKYANRKQYNSRDYRRFLYEWVPGAHVRENRGKDPASANTGSLKLNDINNSFYDIWDLGTRDAVADGGTDGVETGLLAHLEVHHNIVNVLGDDTTTVEAVRFSDEGQIESFGECISTQRMAGEYYNIDVETLILSSNYDQ